jgi:hypothetical protein
LCHFLTCCFPYLKSCCWRWRSVGWEIPHGERNRENKPPPPVRYRNQITAWMPRDDENGRCVGSKRNLLSIIQVYLSGEAMTLYVQYRLRKLHYFFWLAKPPWRKKLFSVVLSWHTLLTIFFFLVQHGRA